MAAAQTPTLTTTFALWPTGTQGTGGSLEAMDPLPCGEVCALVLPTYFECYVLTTTNAIGQPKDPNNNPFNTTACNEYLCTLEHYAILSGCLNCIVANGNEKPFGYSSNTSMTALPEQTGSNAEGRIVNNPNGLIDADQANAILKNVTEGCASGGTTLESTTVTASPTTTGPYFTSWTSGADVDLDVWTGLTEYTDELTALLITVTIPSESSASTSVPAGSGAAGESASAAITSGAATRSIGGRSASVGIVGAFVGIVLGSV